MHTDGIGLENLTLIRKVPGRGSCNIYASTKIMGRETQNTKVDDDVPAYCVFELLSEPIVVLIVNKDGWEHWSPGNSCGMQKQKTCCAATSREYWRKTER